MSDPVNLLADWLEGLLVGAGLAPSLVTFLMSLLGVIAISTFFLVVAIFLVWVERKVVARFQDRLGPNRLGPWGLIQPVADIIKLLIKEDITPNGADRVPYNLAPIMALATVLLLWAVIPLAPTMLGSDINVGVLYIVSAGAISTLGIIMAGWSSNNKYALLGAFRTVAQMVSYEVPMVISLMVPVILANSMGINRIVEAQNVWFIVLAPVAALIFFISSVAEIGRAPFDLTEAESEIVAGFHIEYTGMKFGMFYAGELLHALTVGALFSSLFLGGWRGWGAEAFPLLGLVYLLLKAFLGYYVIMWIKYSVPRIRIDHMLALNWKFLTPLSLTALIMTAILHKLLENTSTLVYAGSMLLANLILGWITLVILQRYARLQRQNFDEDRPLAQPAEASASSSIS